MKKATVHLMSLLLVALTCLSGSASAKDDANRLRNSGRVLKEILDAPDDIPQNVLDKADCVAVFPSAFEDDFVVGDSYGRGAMYCRRGQDFTGSWGAPTMMAIQGGGFGFQIGNLTIDLVLLVMNERGASGILTGRVCLGTDVTIAAGPVGRAPSEETGATLADILGYSRTRGKFAGASLHGWTIRPDKGANRKIYGQKLPVREIVLSGNVAIPSAAQEVTSALDSKTPKRRF
jgi:lipid-binding SYLF domain-containing protein